MGRDGDLSQFSDVLQLCDDCACGPQVEQAAMIPLDQIVSSGLCIGCGLCKSIAPESVEISMTDMGGERPHEVSPLGEEELRLINEVCPGLRVRLDSSETPIDPVWGPVLRLARGHAVDPEVRFRAATGGVLTALGVYLLTTERVDRVLHVAPNSDDPLYWSATTSTTREGVLAGSGSRYGPVAPLTDLMGQLEGPGSMAVMAKPCDAAAVRNLLSVRPQLNTVSYLLVMACGGASRMTKNWALLEDFGIERGEVASFRHRGFGNPGPTRAVTVDGKVRQTSYLSMWEDAGTWDLQWRCKVCPDGMGEVADVVALDCWPGGAPVAEDPGFNGIIARTSAGADLIGSAIEDGALTLTHDDLPVEETLESWQPHQSRRKAAVLSRLSAMKAEGLPLMTTEGLRLEQAEERLSPEQRLHEFDGATERIRRGDQI